MSSGKKRATPNQESEVSRFYDGKSLLITGAAGFLGVVLLDTLLRCCPGIRRIYILLRTKKGVLPEDRKESIFKKEIFFKIRENFPEVLEKVTVIPGDIAQKNLGMCDEDLLKITQEVTIVFHCAASISFLKPLSYMLQHNFVSVKNIIEISRSLQKLDAVVYTSTAFSNCNRKDSIDEIIYKLPFTVDRAIEVIRTGSDDDLNTLFNMCKPKYPNYYTFTKCLAENFLAEKASDLPVSIVRPSIILGCWKGVLPGYIEGDSGIVNLCIGMGKGFIRVFQVDETKHVDCIPVDTVVNTHVIAAWRQVTQRLSSPFIYNCVCGESYAFTWYEFAKKMIDFSNKHPLPNAYQKPGVTVCKNSIKYWSISILDHYIPAIVIDTILWISGRKPKLYSLYRFYDKAMESLQYFVQSEWTFLGENFHTLSDKISIVDSEIFPVDLHGFSIDALTKNLTTGAPAFKWENDKKPYEERIRTTYRRYYFTSFIKWSVIGSIVLLLYAIVF